VPGRPEASPVRVGFWDSGTRSSELAEKNLIVRPGEIVTARIPLE